VGNVNTSSGKTYKDVILHNYGEEDWNWLNFNMHHNPGYDTDVMTGIFHFIKAIYPQNVPGNLKIFLTTGINQKIQTPGYETETWSGKRLSSHIVFLQTEEAVTKYNQHVKNGEPGVIFLHSTC